MVNLLIKDRCSMYNSLEVRVPFADIRIVGMQSSIRDKTSSWSGKGILRKA